MGIIKKLGLGAIAAVAFATSANAAPTITITGPSGTFGDPTVTCPEGTVGSCAFERTFSFSAPGFNLTSLDITSNFTGDNMMANIDFTEVLFNGTAFNILSTGQQEIRNLLNQPLLATNTITVRGTTGGNAAFAGTISLASVAAVPEPGTWMMMILGFGALGFAMRRRRGTNALLMQAA